MNPQPALAMIAEDEPVLARTLARLLQGAWPDLRFTAAAEDGLSAVNTALAALPDVLFLDIQMPGQTGLAAAEAICDEWPADRPVPFLVFVTAYDEYAVAAFERAAVDYLLKPVLPERLAETVTRLRERLLQRQTTQRQAEDAARQLATLQEISASPAPTSPRLQVIQAAVGNSVQMVPVSEVICLEASDKHVNVITRAASYLVRHSLRELVARLDAPDFVQVHRSTFVNLRQVASATRDELGHVRLIVQGLPRPISVSRAFAHRFKRT